MVGRRHRHEKRWIACFAYIYTAWELNQVTLHHWMEWYFIPTGALNQGVDPAGSASPAPTALNKQFRKVKLLQTLPEEAEHSDSSRPLTH